MLLTLPVRDIIPETPRARVVRIDLAGGGFPYRAGQAVLAASHGQTRRPYSLATAPEDAERDGWLELLVGVDAQGAAAHLPLERGALVDVEGPLGEFVFPSVPAERRLLFIAGGTGIAPLRAMLRHALLDGSKEIGVLYSARTPGEFAYEQELREAAAAGRIELKLTVTREAGREDWSGTRGRITRADLAPLVHDPATLCFICGPPALVEEMPRLLANLGVAEERIRMEKWA